MSKLSELLFPYQIPGFCNRGFPKPARDGSQGFVSWPEERCADALMEMVCAHSFFNNKRCVEAGSGCSFPWCVARLALQRFTGDSMDWVWREEAGLRVKSFA